MEEGIYKDQTVISYLLGALSADMAERIDELSITDNEFASRLQVIENDLVDSFVRGELSGETLNRFRSHYMSSPKRREKVAFARGLQKFTARTVIAEPVEKQKPVFLESKATKTDSPTPKKDSSRWFFSFPKMGLQWGLAAAVLLIMVMGGLMVFENVRLRRQISQAQAERQSLEKRERELQSELAAQRSADSEKEQELATLRDRIALLEQRPSETPREASPSPSVQQEPNIIAFVLAPQMRSVGQISTLSVPAKADYVALQLELESNDFASYRTELKSQSGSQVVWKSGRLKATAKGDGKAVSVRLSSRLLKSQIYVMEVSGISPAGEAEIIGTYPFRIVKQ